MPLPDRDSIKRDLVELIRRTGSVSPEEAYTALADAWELTSEERLRVRGGRKLYEHEIRWARQELVIQGVIQRPSMSGRASWRLQSGDAPTVALAGADDISRMTEGFLRPDGWYLSQWLPMYEQSVHLVRNAMDASRIDVALESLWMQKDNSVSNAGQGMLSSLEVKNAINHFRRITVEISQNPIPATFDWVIAELEELRRRGQVSKVPRLLVARAFATLAPDLYHTTVDETKHEKVLRWFEDHTNYRAEEGNWAHRARSLASFLSDLPQLEDSIFVRNMFPWFVFGQLPGNDGRPAFAPGHRPRAKVGVGGQRTVLESMDLRHNAIVEALYLDLVAEHGVEAVGCEQPSGLGGFVDVVVRRDQGTFWIYEVKVAGSASDAIRQALGQLLEYAYRDGAWNPERLYVVAEGAIDAECQKYLGRLRSQFNLPIEYRRVTAEGG
jgi:hypothetical protein